MPPRKTARSARAASARKSRPRPRKETPPKARPPQVHSPFQPGFAPECMACPFGVFFYTVKNTRPDVMEHLMKAGHELFLAFRAVVEQAEDRWQQAERLERIPIS